jgi:hypothetical protein
MKLTDLRPCDACNGPLQGKPGGVRSATWYVVRVTQAMLNPKAAGRTLGLAQFFGQGSISPAALNLAEVMGDCGDDAVMILGDKEPALTTELFICFDCYCGPLDLASVVERRARATEEAGDGRREAE